MKVQLVYPEAKFLYNSTGCGWLFPLGLLSIASYINPKTLHKIEILDSSTQSQKEIESKIDGDIIGISATILNYQNSLRIAEIAKRKKETMVVLGGAYASPLAENILRNQSYIDAVISGDGEFAFFNFINGQPLETINNVTFRQDNHIKTNLREEIDLNEFPFIDFSFIDFGPYFLNYKKKYPNSPFKRPLTHYSQKGCKWRIKKGCIFCGLPDKKFRKKSPKRIWNELEKLIKEYNFDYIFETADDFTSDKSWLEELVKTKPKYINPMWDIFSRANNLNRETLDLLKQLNVYQICIGIESGDIDCLKKSYKGSTPKINLDTAKLLQQYKIKLLPSFVFGLPGESEKSLKKTKQFIEEIRTLENIEDFLLFPMTPLPSSYAFRTLLRIPEMKEKYEKEDNLNVEELQKDWTKYFCNVDYNTIKGNISEIENIIR